MEVLAVDELECIEMACGRVAGFGPGDVESNHAVVAVADGEFGYLDAASRVSHGGDQCADTDVAAF